MKPLHPTARFIAVTAFALASIYLVVKFSGGGGVPAARPRDEQRLTALNATSAATVGAPDHVYEVTVAQSTPMSFLSATENTIHQGEVVQFVVTTDRPGAVIVHGLSDMQTLDVKGTTLVSFKAVYSGRFALHFHGTDGSHFELTALNVMPAQGLR